MSEGILAMDNNLNIININQSSLNLLSLKDTKSDININTILLELNIIEEFNDIISNNTKGSIVKEYSNKILNFSISPIKNNLNECVPKEAKKCRYFQYVKAKVEYGKVEALNKQIKEILEYLKF